MKRRAERLYDRPVRTASAARRSTGPAPETTRLDDIRAATINAARAFRQADSLGTIAPGMVAGLIALDGDPLSDIGAMSRVRFVMSPGRPR